MPSAEHETPLELADLDPSLVAWLVTDLFGIKVPEYHHAATQSTEIRVLVRKKQADCLVVLYDAQNRPLLAVVFEVQRGRDKTKPLTWKVYLVDFEKKLGIPVALVVYCPTTALADWCRRKVDESNGPSLFLQPLIFTPQDVPVVLDESLARAHPALAILSAVCHATRPDIEQMFPAILAAIQSTDNTKVDSYYDVVWSALPAPAQTQWEEYMTVTIGREYRNPALREAAAKGRAEGKAEGKAEGEARAILLVLESRGVPVPDDARERVLACADYERLDTWLRRAANATSVAEVLGDD